MASNEHNPRRSGPGNCLQMVLNTPELLESVLLQLDLRTLLASAPLVSRSWKTLIDGSPALQQALFFLPINANDGKNKTNDLHCEYQFNPLLKDSFPAWFHRNFSSEITNLLPWIKSKSNLFLRPEASWRRMLVCQPPVYKLGCVDIATVQWSYRATVQVSARKSGMYMADLFDICMNGVISNIQIYWTCQGQQFDTHKQLNFAQGTWPYVKRAKAEAEILVLQCSCADSDCDEDLLDEDQDEDEDSLANEDSLSVEDSLALYKEIFEFVDKYKSLQSLEDEWVKTVEGMFD